MKFENEEGEEAKHQKESIRMCQVNKIGVRVGKEQRGMDGANYRLIIAQ